MVSVMILSAPLRASCSLSLVNQRGPALAYTSGGPHLPVPAEAEPVATSRKLADIADRAAADALGQLEGLGDREHRAFGGVLLASATDAVSAPGLCLGRPARAHAGPHR